MQVIKFANIETNLTGHITMMHKIEILKYDDIYVVTFRKYFSDEKKCSLTFSESYLKIEDAQEKFDFFVHLAMNY